jgi:predicted RNase H-like HicB family nuclease
MVAQMSKYDAVVTRDGDYWLIRVPAVDRSTQARTLAEIEPMARDLVAVMLDVDPSTVEIEVDLHLPTHVQAHLARAGQLRADEARARAEAAAEIRAAATELHDRCGIPLRDLGKILGVSYQRAGQLTKKSA